MLIVTGHLLVAPEGRGAYLRGCADIVVRARQAPGCLDFTIGADLVDPRRVNLTERWSDARALETFRGTGPSQEQADQILHAEVVEYEVSPASEMPG